jgi:membrane protease YdiL (CAAX protease family)
VGTTTLVAGLDPGLAHQLGHLLRVLAAVALFAYLALVLPGQGRGQYRPVTPAGTGTAVVADGPLCWRRAWRSAVAAAALAGAALLVAALAGTSPAAVGLAAPARSTFEGRSGLAVGAVAAMAAAWLALGCRRRRRPRGRPRLRPRLRSRPGWPAWVSASVPALLPVTPGQRRAFAVLALSAGVTEEVVYRGVVFSLLLAAGAPLWAALTAQAALFGLAHLYQGRAGVALATVAGLLLGLLARGSGGLLIPMVAHAAFDLRLLLPVRPRTGAHPAAGARSAADLVAQAQVLATAEAVHHVGDQAVARDEHHAQLTGHRAVGGRQPGLGVDDHLLSAGRPGRGERLAQPGPGGGGHQQHR